MPTPLQAVRVALSLSVGGSVIRRAMLKAARRLARSVLGKPADKGLLYQHDYGAGGYEAYRRAQIFHNKRKFDRVFADKLTLEVVADYLRSRRPQRGICHGARNGWEVARLKELLGCEMIGTDISDTASSVPDMVQWDFHEVNPEWIGRFDFVYTNSLDQAFDPEKALAAWIGQLAPGGQLLVEHTMMHGTAKKGEMDPFGAHPMLMPYLIFEWGRGKDGPPYRLADILHVDPPERKGHVWLFVIEPVAPV
jgi:SAM-dependent methyltransferase